MYDLIITEKPSAAKKIADALADGKAIKESVSGVPYYLLTHGKKDIVVACAVGHLYGLTQKTGKRSEYPVFEIEWVPTADMNKKSDFTKKYLRVIKKLAKDATEFTVATDYDVEGEVIGLNVIRFACKKKDAKRMKFSTLTKDELIKSYENASKTLDWGQAKAGETRHKLDWFYGINTSRALTHAISSQGSFKVMSTGRVQGPALKLIVDKEDEIEKFKAVPYWQIELDAKKEKSLIISWHVEDKFWEKEKASTAYEKIKGEKEATVSGVKKSSFKQAPPTPFDLTSLQIEAHKTIRISPKKTLELAQELYTSSYISYPRTSSQQLPPSIGFSKIIKSLAKKFPKETAIILAKKNLVPNNGKKTDPAHPAIYPTGILPVKLDADQAKLYELIARRFLATFADPALRETLNLKIKCKDEDFVAKGTTTKEKGWHEIYGPFVMLKEEELPAVEKDEVLAVDKIELHSKETQPPKRYTEASIIKELEKRGLGTKATRASILDTLFHRGYVDGKSIKATELGIRTFRTLNKYSPTITDEDLTRHFEDEMKKIREHKIEIKNVLDEAKTSIGKIIDEFKTHEADIGKELSAANRETQDEMNYIGECPICKKGKLMQKRGKYGKFVGCSKYPDCKAVFKLPHNGKIMSANKECEACKYPVIRVIRARKKPMEVCINPECPTKQSDDADTQKETEELEKGTVEKECPKCKNPLIVRTSIYGKFLGCTKFPKCRYTEKISNGVLKEDFK